MNESNHSKTYRFEESKSGHMIPVVDGVYMHSMLDPIKESLSMAEQYSDDIQKNPIGLILGIGHGYHVHALHESFRIFHEDRQKWELYVIESDPRNVMSYMEYQAKHYPEISKKIKVFCLPVNQLYQNNFFLELLLKKPLIIPHRPSYQKNIDYYHSVLKFKRNNRIDAIAPLLNKEMRELMTESLPAAALEKEFSEYLKDIEQKNYWDFSDRVALLLQSIGIEKRS